MKPKIDLNDPIIAQRMTELKEQYLIALNVNQKVENAVLPVLSILPRKAHQKPHTKPEQIGSCVLVNIKDQYFLFTATHVLNEFRNSFCIGEGKGTPSIQPIGDMYRSNENLSDSIDQYDACVYHITSQLSDSLKANAVTLDDMDVLQSPNLAPVFLITGFRLKKSNVKQLSFNSEREGFPTIEHSIEDYYRLAINPKSHIMVAYEDQILINGNWTTSPSPRGMSGGAIIKVAGTDIWNPDNRSSTPRQLLSAIIIERHNKKGRDQSRLIGTRVNIHLQILLQNMPELFKP